MNLLSPAFVGAIRRSLAHQGDRRRAQMKVGHPAFVGGFRESHHSRLSGKLYSLISIDSLSTFCGEDQYSQVAGSGSKVGSQASGA
jgi:hypothetical protein